MTDLRDVEKRLDQMYAELASLKRIVLLSLPAQQTKDEKTWDDLMAASVEISEKWTGPGAVEEIRTQRER